MLDESSEPRDETICRKLLRTEDLQILEIRVGVLHHSCHNGHLLLPVNYRANEFRLVLFKN